MHIKQTFRCFVCATRCTQHYIYCIKLQVITTMTTTTATTMALNTVLLWQRYFRYKQLLLNIIKTQRKFVLFSLSSTFVIIFNKRLRYFCRPCRRRLCRRMWQRKQHKQRKKPKNGSRYRQMIILSIAINSIKAEQEIEKNRKRTKKTVIGSTRIFSLHDYVIIERWSMICVASFRSRLRNSRTLWVCVSAEWATAPEK